MADGTFLPYGTPPTPVPLKAPDDWSPYHNRIKFEAVEFAFKKCHMLARNLDLLCDLMAVTLTKHHDTPPFANHKDLHNVVPPWMDDEFEVWYRDPCGMAYNIIANPNYKDEIDYVPYHFMSRDWTWKQADTILQDPETHRSALVPVKTVLNSDKTTVSVGTGNNEYYPLYTSISNVHNTVQHTHHDALVIIGFLTIPKTDKSHSKDDAFRIFCHQLFHSSLSTILSTLRPVMTTYEVVHCGDGHFWHIIYSLGPYIVDYEEQLVLSFCTNLDGGGIYHTHEFTDFLINKLHADVLWDEFGLIGDLVMTDIHELLSFDLLHQLIKGAFKDHLIDWVAKYLKAMHRTKQSEEIMSDIDRRVAAVASFSGDDSKVLMKVFLPAIEVHIPQDMVHAFHALLEFCHLVQCNVITEDILIQIQDALRHFHHYRKIFNTVIPTFSLPHQHLMAHYMDMIRLFGAPNGLCSLITESKHIEAVKEPWRWSSRHNALGMLTGTILSSALAALAADENEQVAPTIAPQPHAPVNEPQPDIDDGEIVDSPMVFAYVALAKTPHDAHNPKGIPAAGLPRHEGKLQVFNSAVAIFYAPSDLSGIGGMRHKHIHACPLWEINAEGMRGLKVAKVICFFSFKNNWEVYQCALIQWFKIGDCPDEDTGMWMVAPSFHEDSLRDLAVIHIEMVFHAAHLIPIYGSEYIPPSLKFYQSLDTFSLFYVNKYTDHHVFKIVS
ncbi:hypothetical protein BDR04DRAFT_1129339 [Suillus decipiens]|nr:hypothetical protein BDR04DRAFT_1129339 [Suillus decipiens]